MLGIGSYLLPVIGTIAGLVMISLSRWWTTRQKLVAVALSVASFVVVLVLGGAIFLFAVSNQGPTPDGPAKPAIPSHIPSVMR
jgi:hypothetical protein